MNFLALLKQEKALALHKKGTSVVKKGLKKNRDIGELIHLLEQKEKTECLHRCCTELVFHSQTPDIQSPIGESKIHPDTMESMYYLPEWVTNEMESYLLERIYDDSCSTLHWTKLRTRSVQMWGGNVNASPVFIPERLPQWLNQVTALLGQMDIFPLAYPPNHVLINEYEPGQEILLHQDGKRYAPYVAILSLGTSATLRFQLHRRKAREHEQAAEPIDIRLDERSLFVFKDKVYHDYLHGILPLVSTQTRISLTIRHVFTQDSINKGVP